jgi:methionyl aminopeptidase
MDTARESLRRGIDAARVGARVGDIGHSMQSFAQARGLRLLAQYTGHGLGTRLWEPPQVPAVGRPGTGDRLVEGLVITIEPIVVAGSPRVIVDDDGWTVRTADGKSAAQFEHTVLLTSQGAHILTAA